jgi:hypothetical protein
VYSSLFFIEEFVSAFKSTVLIEKRFPFYEANTNISTKFSTNCIDINLPSNGGEED